MGLGQLFQERPAAVLRTSFPLRVFRSAHRWVSWSTPHYRRSVARPWTWGRVWWDAQPQTQNDDFSEEKNDVHCNQGITCFRFFSCLFICNFPTWQNWVGCVILCWVSCLTVAAGWARRVGVNFEFGMVRRLGNVQLILLLFLPILRFLKLLRYFDTRPC